MYSRGMRTQRDLRRDGSPGAKEQAVDTDVGSHKRGILQTILAGNICSPNMSSSGSSHVGPVASLSSSWLLLHSFRCRTEARGKTLIRE